MTTLNEFGLSDWTMNDLRSVFRRHPKVRKVILYHEELLRIYNDIDDLGLLYKVDLLHYEEKRGTPIGEHIDRAGKVFYQQKPHY